MLIDIGFHYSSRDITAKQNEQDYCQGLLHFSLFSIMVGNMTGKEGLNPTVKILKFSNYLSVLSVMEERL